MKRALVLGGALIALGLAVSLPARAADDDLAAGSGYGEQNLSFERWCSEIKRYSADQCAAHKPEDQAAYQETKDRLSELEIQHGKDQRKERDFFKQQDSHRAQTTLPNL